MNDTKKNSRRILHLGILAFAPIALFTLWTIYYFVILKDYIVQYRLENHMEMAGTTFEYYTPLFILFGINFLITLISFLFFGLNVWTRTDMPVGNKAVWVVFLATFNILAYPVYWYMHIKNDFVRADNASPALS